MDIVYDNNGTTSNDYIRGVAGLIYRVDADDNINYIRTDYHGNVADINTYSGTVIQTYKYDAYGNVTEQTGTDENPFAYCGEYYDEETGFIYLRNRYYDPSLGRFITEDPVKDGNNWYVYCGGNPVVFTDPWGLVYYVNGLEEQENRFLEYVRVNYGDSRFKLTTDSKKLYIDESLVNTYNGGSHTFRNIIDAGMSSSDIITVNFDDTVEFSQTKLYIGETEITPNNYNNDMYTENRSVTIVLGQDFDFIHENVHGVDWVEKKDQQIIYGKGYYAYGYIFNYWTEARAITYTNIINDELGKTKDNYRSTYYRYYWYDNNYNKIEYTLPKRYGMFPYEASNGKAAVPQFCDYGQNVYQCYLKYLSIGRE